jgi:hypothetical protein
MDFARVAANTVATLVDNSFRDARLTARPFHAKFASLAPTLSNNRGSSATLSLCRGETHTRIFRSIG